MRLGTTLLAALLLSGSSASFADEDFCGYLAPGKLTFRYIDWSDKRTALDLSVPMRDGKARFHKLTVSIGDGDDNVSFELATGDEQGRAEGVVHLPRDHKIVRISAIYHEGRCFRELEATFENGKRVWPLAGEK